MGEWRKSVGSGADSMEVRRYDQQCVVMQHLCERRDKKRRVFNLENVNLLQGGRVYYFSCVLFEA